MDEEQRQAYLAEARRAKEKRGWLVQGVIGSPLGSRAPYWYYTVGLTEFDHPELTMSGPDPDVATSILNDLGERVRAGTVYRDGDTVTDVVVGFTIRLVTATDFTTFPPSMVEVFYPDRAVHALQVVFPDSQGRFWDEDGYTMGQAQDLMFA